MAFVTQYVVYSMGERMSDRGTDRAFLSLDDAIRYAVGSQRRKPKAKIWVDKYTPDGGRIVVTAEQIKSQAKSGGGGGEGDSGMVRRRKDGRFVKGSGAKKRKKRKGSRGIVGRAKRAVKRVVRRIRGKGGALEKRVTRLEHNLHAVQHTTVAVVNQFLGAAGRKKITHVPGYITPTGRKLGTGHKMIQLGPGR